MRSLIKQLLNLISLALAFPMALLSGFGRSELVFAFGAQSFSLLPGLPGSYLRNAYYRMTLQKCSPTSRIEFGVCFAHPQATVGNGVFIGSNCILGRTKIGDRTQIGSAVQILSGGKQHKRAADGKIQGAEKGVFESVSIGADCWIGAAAIVMADVGEGSTIGAGSVVVHPIPAGCVAVGSPARVIRGGNE